MDDAYRFHRISSNITELDPRPYKVDQDEEDKANHYMKREEEQ